MVEYKKNYADGNLLSHILSNKNRKDVEYKIFSKLRYHCHTKDNKDEGIRLTKK
jgi:hypothetical protein